MNKTIKIISPYQDFKPVIASAVVHESRAEGGRGLKPLYKLSDPSCSTKTDAGRSIIFEG